jgi:cephalosporin-C deacetylase-like acetyl esterase
MAAPEDFDAYWATERKKLSDVPFNVRLTPVKSAVAGVECFDVQAECLGAPMSGYLARPVGAAPGSLPAIVLCHGAGVASSRLAVAAQWAKDGFIALDFNAHGLPNGQPQDFYKDLYAGELKQYYLKGPNSRETIFFHELFLRLARAIDVVTARPEWDGKILVVNGRSQGGGQAIAAAGLDPRVTFFAAQIPAMCDHTGVMAGRINGWPKIVPMTDGKPDALALQASRYFDGVNFAARTKADAFFTVGFIDISCPPSSVYAAYNAIRGKKAIVDNFRSGHIATAEGDEQVRGTILAHVKAAGAR